MITQKSWGTPNNKRLVLKSSDKTKHCFVNTPTWTEPLKQIITAVEPGFLFLLVDQLRGFGQVSALTMIQHLFSSYRAVNEIELEEKAVNMMGTYNPAEPLS